MSTKSTIAYRHHEPADTHDCPFCKMRHVRQDAPAEFHFYTEMMDDKSVYLTIDGKTLKIPRDIYDVIVAKAPEVKIHLGEATQVRAEEAAEAKRILSPEEEEA